MRTIRILKVITYPAFGAFQFVVLPWWFALPIAVGLFGLAALNLSQLLGPAGRAEQEQR